MSNDLIKKDYLKKIELIQKYNKNYYNKDKPVVSDNEFDKLKKVSSDAQNILILRLFIIQLYNTNIRWRRW